MALEPNEVIVKQTSVKNKSVLVATTEQLMFTRPLLSAHMEMCYIEKNYTRHVSLR